MYICIHIYTYRIALVFHSFNSVKIGFVTLDRSTISTQKCDKWVNNIYLFCYLIFSIIMFQFNEKMVFCIGDTCVNVILNRSCLHSFAHTSSFPYLHRKHRWTIAIWALEHSYKLIKRQFYFHSSDRMLSWHFEKDTKTISYSVHFSR